MAGRKTYTSLPSSGKSQAQKPRHKKRNNALDAFAIASEQVSDLPKIRQHRLGQSEGPLHRPGKRSRRDDDDEEEDGEEEDEVENKRRRKTSKGRFDQLDIDMGSDSEGNEWMMGAVDSDDDSDLDSDEAFGESDEERFADMAFSGSSKKSKSKRNQDSDVDLDEGDEGSDQESDWDEDAAVDLADMLNDSEEEEDVKKSRPRKNGGRGDPDDESSDDGSAESSDSDDSSASSVEDEDEDDDDADPEKLAALQDLIANLPESDKKAKIRREGANEFDKPSDFGIKSQTKLTLEDLGLPGVSDPHVKKSLKLLSDAAPSKRKGIPAKLAVPLPKRQQDSLDRSAAYDETKKTLSRWVDTVQHNRQADHLMFPLPDPDQASNLQNVRLQNTTSAKPFNELEAAIQNILEESGLGAADGKDDEEKLQEFEELEASKQTMEEVKARRAQLRMARELMFREEARAKRIKKIKSKSWRRVHRKEREREAQKEQQALIEAGLEPSDDERERQDRRRAMERMGSRHRDSKWAKATKEIGRAAWDDEARAGITEMARKNEELRKRVEGKAPSGDNDFSDESSESDDLSDDDDDDTAAFKLRRQLDKVSGADNDERTGPGSKLMNMKFMRRGEEAQRKENDATIARIRRELDGEGSDEEDEPEEVGRRSFGAEKAMDFGLGTTKVNKSQFEEPEEFDDEDDVVIKTNSTEASAKPTRSQAPKKTNSSHKNLQSSSAAQDSEGGAWSRTLDRKDIGDLTEARLRKQKMKNNDVEIDLSQVAIAGKQTKTKPAKSTKTSTTTTLQVGSDDSDSDDDNDNNNLRLPYAIRDQELIKRAFAGADVVGEFEAEKEQAIESDEEKVIDNTLPGWGSWVGDGLSKRAQKRNTGRVVTKKAGVKASDRKDAKLERVIISEKQVKKNNKYLASTLPHPFETKAQYERSLRIPVGPEWTTKETFQTSTKPRVLVKQGIIAPISKPVV